MEIEGRVSIPRIQVILLSTYPNMPTGMYTTFQDGLKAIKIVLIKDSNDSLIGQACPSPVRTEISFNTPGIVFKSGCYLGTISCVSC